MLSLMRRHSRSIVIKLIYVGLILSFLVWGIGSYNSRDDFIAVTVNGEGILMNDYRDSFENLVNYYRQTLKDNFNEEMIVALKLKKQALDNMINRVILLEAADKQGHRVSKDEVSARIQSFSEFQKDGRFDKEAYFNVLNANRLKPGDFEKEQRELLLMGKLEGAIKGGAAVSEEEVLEGYKREKTKVVLSFIKLSPALFENKVSVKLSEQKDYFSANVGAFMIPQKIQLGYLILDPKDFKKEVNLTREEYDDYYNSYIGDFIIPEKVKARHILIKFGDNKEKAKTEAEAILKRVKAGEKFARLAKKYSEDEETAKKGGALGFFERGEMVRAFEDAAFSMEKGAVSDLVESLYGYHIIKVLDKVEEKTKPLDEVRGEIRTVLEEEITRELAESKGDDIYYETLKGSKSLEALTKEDGLSYRKTISFGLDAIPAALDGVSDVVQNAGTMEPGWMSRPKEWENKFYIVALLEKAPPREPVFEEVKNAVKKVVAGEKAKEAALVRGEKLLAELKKGKSLKALARKQGLKVETTDPFNRVRNVVPGIGVSEEIVSRAFELASTNPLPDKTYRVGDDVIIFRLKEIKRVDQKTFDEERELFKAKLLDQRRNEVYRQWLEEARRKATITYHEDLIDLKG